MRLVTFGSAGPHASLVSQQSVRKAIKALVTAHRPPIAVDPETLDAGLFVNTPHGVELGYRVLRVPAVDRGALAAAGSAVATLVRARIPEFRRTMAADGSAPPGGWESTALLVVGGVLLDILVGQHLRAEGVIGQVSGGWRLWVLPEATDMAGTKTVSVGMRCHHDAGLRLGAGVMWIGASGQAPCLPLLTDLAAVLTDTDSGRSKAAAVLRMRSGGWLDGQRQRFLLLDPGTPLFTALDATAADLVNDVYRPLLTGDTETGDVHAKLMISRMIMECGLTELVRAATLPELEAPITCLAWLGPNWQLFEEAAAVRESAREPDHAGR